MSNSAITTLRVFDHLSAGRPRPDDLARIAAPLTSMLTAELEGAQQYLCVPEEEILLASLGRAFARTIGDGDLAVDVYANRHFAVVLACRGVRRASATDALQATHRALATNLQPVGIPDVFFSYLGTDQEPAPLPSQGHALEVRVYRNGGQLQMDWWYDTRRLDRHTVEEFTEQFPLALIDLTSDAAPVQDASQMTTMAGARY